MEHTGLNPFGAFSRALRTEEPNSGLAAGLTFGEAGFPAEDGPGAGLIEGMTRGGRPRVPEDEKRRSLSISLPPAAIEKVDSAAEALGKNRSEMIAEIINEYQPLYLVLAMRKQRNKASSPYLEAAATLARQQDASEATATPVSDGVAAIVSAALTSFVNPERTIEEVSAAIEAFTEAARSAERR